MDVAEKSLRLLSSTAGRDRVNRLVQFAAKFLSLYLDSHEEYAQRFTALAAHISQSRKRIPITPLIHFFSHAGRQTGGVSPRRTPHAPIAAERFSRTHDIHLTSPKIRSSGSSRS